MFSPRRRPWFKKTVSIDVIVQAAYCSGCSKEEARIPTRVELMDGRLQATSGGLPPGWSGVFYSGQGGSSESNYCVDCSPAVARSISSLPTCEKGTSQ